MPLTNRNSPRSWPALARLCVRLAACGLLAAALAGTSADAKTFLLNRPAPPFSRLDLHGAHVSLAQYRGKVILLNFWATWCAPCLAEMPQFMQWQKQYAGQGFQVLGVSIDDSPALAARTAEKLRLNYPVLMGDAALLEQYGGILGVPVTFLIDRRGIVRARIDGESDPRALEREIRGLLAAPAE